MKKNMDRRKFLQQSTQITTASAGMLILPLNPFKNPDMNSVDDEINIIGPKKGYTPQVGTLVSMMNWMRDTILRPVNSLSTKDLDYIHDENANSIGAMLWHLAATERYYQLNTFENMSWGSWSGDIKKEWDTPMGLGDKGRKKIKGHSLDFYLDKLSTVRENTLKELTKRDDDWLLSVDRDWPWGPTNNYCKWFHVVEHESNHNGQIKMIASRLPG